MIDLHCHILPGIDDGAKTLDHSLAMARIAVADGIHTLACTPHIYPGMYMNDGPGIARARDALQAELDRHAIALKLVVGADVHLVPGLIEGIRSGRVPTLNGSRYFLLEPSHTAPPPRLEAQVAELIAAGYTPIVTHPERLAWVEGHYPVFKRLIAQGAWMQVTAGALTGVFGRRARYWGERFIGEGHTHLLATDAHTTGRRLPRLTEGLAVARRLVGEREASRLVNERPNAVLNNLPPRDVERPEVVTTRASLIGRWWSGRLASSR
ncbi:MAG: capsular biosynthesis protein [Hydrogenophaga sp.]|uniref:tyrosine-protein phosphatase n=1 Tax=Hydrogenophaga sp. TaxID=1904254 RepID=UPI0016A3EC3A|nr:CpsB/CapC family capsule biosynthesis tyrosine phosphatase [Hydrogenophaga sp.]NIM39771.1 capsular biosynthesis protein [Hydrogenophaga sp.]NIN24975.1 capsular biosynthesis protein [Hydrogenophaga sp.]NIN29487.1 capsular biosynthesis protein [Hydrogenophaga sp.]NIN54010.1 capsular biosynthesis protein [Hydrogenophaga sp.]NIO50214.1 capsular biosynthesis protein [Hydrogenophaga sp.]